MFCDLAVCSDIHALRLAKMNYPVNKPGRDMMTGIKRSPRFSSYAFEVWKKLTRLAYIVSRILR